MFKSQDDTKVIRKDIRKEMEIFFSAFTISIVLSLGIPQTHIVTAAQKIRKILEKNKAQKVSRVNSIYRQTKKKLWGR